VLLPAEPPDDMTELVQSIHHMPFVSAAGVIWKSGTDFACSGIDLSDYWTQ
jgi:hypothetical protein